MLKMMSSGTTPVSSWPSLKVQSSSHALTILPPHAVWSGFGFSSSHPLCSQSCDCSTLDDCYCFHMEPRFTPLLWAHVKVVYLTCHQKSRETQPLHCCSHAIDWSLQCAQGKNPKPTVLNCPPNVQWSSQQLHVACSTHNAVVKLLWRNLYVERVPVVHYRTLQTDSTSL